MRHLISLLLVILSGQHACLAEEFIVVRGNENYPPHEFIEDGEIRGFHIEIINNVASKLGAEFRIESYPWKRASLLMQQGKADAITYISKTKEREKFAIFLEDNILSKTASTFICLTPRLKYIHFDGSMNSISNYIIGVQLGYFYGNEFDQTKRLNKIEIVSIPQMLDTLRAKRIDLGVFSLDEYRAFKKAGKMDGISLVKPYISEFNNYIAFSIPKNRSALAQQFAKALKEFKQSEQFQRLKVKYGLID
ncbi:substrate-binding periplasmic protein [Litoribacillus peritrichatus]|uniref:ABC transporter substrate-binding protein n=1 Tax=Litoribacillus peritrichatus TaxID=718191 RepID=A0ABP7MB42_9GAMM